MGMGRENGVRGAQGSSCCLVIAWAFLLFGTVSPYWLWRRTFYWNTWGTTSTLASGIYPISSSSGSTPCYWGWRCTVVSQWNHISSFNNTLCTGDYYEKVGKYGFCTAENGDVQTPSKISAIQGLMISATICLFLASILSCVPNGKSAGVAGIFSFIGCILSCAAFSVATSYDYYQKFHDPWYLPFTTDSSGETLLTLSSPATLYWGPGFYLTILAFVMSLFTTCSLLASAKAIDESEDLDGNYGAGTGSQAEAQEYGYGAPVQT